MNKKMIRNIVIILAVLLLLAAGILVLNRMDTDPAAPEKTPLPQFTAYKVENDQIDSFTIQMGSQVLAVKNEGDSNWSINGVSPEELDKSKVESLVTTVNTVVSNYEIEKEVSDLSPYGLNQPYVTVTVTLKDGTNDVLLIGDKSPTLGEHFFMKQGDSTVYTLYAYKVDTLVKPLSYYQSFNRFSVNIDDITQVTMFRRGQDTLELRLKNNQDKENYNIIWEVTQPYSEPLNAIDNFVDDNILAPLSELSVSEPAAAGRDYGFVNPAARLTIISAPYQEDGTRGAAKTQEMVIGNTENGYTYVQLDGKAYAVPSASLQFVYTDAFLAVSKLTALVDIAGVEQVRISAGDKTTVMDIAHPDESTFSFHINGHEADEKLSKQMYQEMISLSCDALYQNEQLQEKALTLFFKGYQGAGDVTVEFFSINELNYAITRNGKTQFVIKKSKVNDMLAKLNEYVNHPKEQ